MRPRGESINADTIARIMALVEEQERLESGRGVALLDEVMRRVKSLGAEALEETSDELPLLLSQ